MPHRARIQELSEPMPVARAMVTASSTLILPREIWPDLQKKLADSANANARSNVFSGHLFSASVARSKPSAKWPRSHQNKERIAVSRRAVSGLVFSAQSNADRRL